MATVAKDFQTRNGVKAGGTVEGTTLKSTVSTGTAPLEVASTTKVGNLNASFLNGKDDTAFASSSNKLSDFSATTSSELASVISDETGSGKLVFGTSPEILTSLTTSSGTFALLNTNATTVNFAGAATAVNIGASSGTTTVNNNLTVTGNLTVNGTTTTINSTTQTVDDPILTLGGDTAPSSDDNKDRGIEFRYHNGSSAKVGFFGYRDSNGRLAFIPDATNTSEVFSGTLGDIEATNFRGALVGNADTATSTPLLSDTNAAQSSAGVTVSANNTPTTVGTFSTSTYTTAEYLIQAKQGTKMTSTHVMVMWDGTDVQVAEWGYVDATAGAANVTFTATQSAGTVTLSASSSDAATTNVVIKTSVTYIKS